MWPAAGPAPAEFCSPCVTCMRINDDDGDEIAVYLGNGTRCPWLLRNVIGNLGHLE